MAFGKYYTDQWTSFNISPHKVEGCSASQFEQELNGIQADVESVQKHILDSSFVVEVKGFNVC